MRPSLDEELERALAFTWRAAIFGFMTGAAFGYVIAAVLNTRWMLSP